MQAGQKYGMQTMNQSLHQAVVNKWITLDEALSRSADGGELAADARRTGRAR